MHARRKLIAAAGAIMLAALVATSAAGHNRGRFDRIRPALSGNLANRTFAGWRFNVKGADAIQAKFKVPALKCGPAMTGVAPGVLMETGTSRHPMDSAAVLVLVCQGGKPHLVTEVFVNCVSTCAVSKSGPAPHVGDTMGVYATRSGGHVTQAGIADLTPGHRFMLMDEANGAPPLVFAEVIDDSVDISGRQLPVVKFGMLPWSAGKITSGTASKPIGSIPIGSTGRQAYDMKTKTGVLQIRTGAIGGRHNNSFNTTWKHS